MKKLVLKKATSVTEIEMKTAVCNFCGEGGKKCFRGPVPVRVSVLIPKLKCERVGINPEPKIFSLGYNCEDMRFAWVEDTNNPLEEETKEDHGDVCTDCVKQLVKLIK